MKDLRLLCTCVLLTVFLGLKAQTDTLKKTTHLKKWDHEFGMNLYTLNIRGGDYYSKYSAVVDNYAASGFYCKFYRGKNSIRTSADFLQKIILDRYSHSSNTLSLRSLQLVAGYQRHFGNKKITPYIFTDFTFNYSRERRYANYLGYDYIGYYNLPLTSRSAIFGVTPGIGLRIRIKRNITLSVESAAEFFYMKTSENGTGNYYESTGLTAKPLKCSFGFMF